MIFIHSVNQVSPECLLTEPCRAPSLWYKRKSKSPPQSYTAGRTHCGQDTLQTGQSVKGRQNSGQGSFPQISAEVPQWVQVTGDSKSSRRTESSSGARLEHCRCPIGPNLFLQSCFPFLSYLYPQCSQNVPATVSVLLPASSKRLVSSQSTKAWQFPKPFSKAASSTRGPLPFLSHRPSGEFWRLKNLGPLGFVPSEHFSHYEL